ncbi:MAG: calcium-translocating P-type ATPase, PMCA-type [Oscillospiraceae bacterium]|nr:calcium-translocating P-type ATPase, PMCA-type [Oscillospiraceae bacterium]
MQKKYGLTDDEVKASREKYGANLLTKKETETFWGKYLENFQDPIIRILLVALVVDIVFVIFGKADWYEAVGILMAVLLATFVSTFSEYRNESTFQKLQEEASRIKCKVYRNNDLVELPLDDLVVSDCILLQTGDKIPVDGILLSGDIKVDQSTLNGESKEATKEVMPSDYVDNSQSIDFLNKYNLYRGSVVVSGEAIMKANAVGDNTVYGKLAGELQVEERDSPLKVKLSKLADGISKFGYIGGVAIAIAFMFKVIFVDNHFDPNLINGYFSNNWAGVLQDILNAVIIAVVIIVVAVPEGLPLMIAIVSSLNMRKMLNDNVLVRKIAGIETAGSLNILFSDKTGTITKGKLEVVTFVDGELNEYKKFSDIKQDIRNMFKLSAILNTGALISGEGKNRKIVGGNATERSILEFLREDNDFNDANIVKVCNMPFSSDRKLSAIQVTGKVNLTFIKGAPERILKYCKYYYDEKGKKILLTNKDKIDQKITELSERAIRVLAFATCEGDLKEDRLPLEDFTLVGIIGIRDEVREESISAIKEVNSAGVQVVMITGDRKETAVAIAKDAGLITSKDDIVLTSDEVHKLSDDQLKEVLPRLKVVARALPDDKSRFVRIAQEKNLVVGMTGDGVNDSPALKKSDVGFAMGSGTEVAKEAGDIVILDDNFLSIEKAILYGRTIYTSIRKFIVFQLTINVSAVGISFLGPLFGIDRPLSITQMLWVNLVMDTLAAIAFGGEPALRRFMAERPKRRDESIVSKKMWSEILIDGVFVTALSLVFLLTNIYRQNFRSAPNEIYVYTGYFAFFILTALFNAFNARTESLNLFEHILENKNFIFIMSLILVVQILMTYVGGDVLRTAGLNGKEWLTVILLAFIIIPLDLIRKIVMNTNKN